jgi:hypothetical protein
MFIIVLFTFLFITAGEKGQKIGGASGRFHARLSEAIFL